MLNVKFKKTGDAVFISHIDVQNTINRSVRRAGYEPQLSKGFNPHTLLKLSPPLPLGIESEAEYFTLYLDGVEPDAFVKSFNDNAPQGLKAIYAIETKTYPNLAGKIVASDYLIRDNRLKSCQKNIKQRIEEGFIVSHKGKQETIQKSVSDLILRYSFDEEGLFVKLAAGNVTLRADRFVEALNGYLGLDISITDIVRTAQYVQQDNDLMDADLYIQNIAQNS